MKQNPCLSMRGIISVLNTPFTTADAIDHEGLATHVRYALDAGVAGFLVPALAGEVGSLSDAERMATTGTVLDTVRGTVPVIGCATAADDAVRIALAEQLTQRGCAGILAAIPYTNPEDYAARVRELAQVKMGFLMLQDWSPDSTGLPISLIGRLFNTTPSFKCIKIETALAGPKYTEVLRETEGRLHVSGGWAVTQMMEGLDRGVHAFMPTGLERSYVRIYRRYASGDRNGALRLFHRVLPILAFSNQHLDLSIQFFKALLHQQGLCATARVRSPIIPWDAHQIATANELITLALELEAEDSM